MGLSYSRGDLRGCLLLRFSVPLGTWHQWVHALPCSEAWRVFSGVFLGEGTATSPGVSCLLERGTQASAKP